MNNVDKARNVFSHENWGCLGGTALLVLLLAAGGGAIALREGDNSSSAPQKGNNFSIDLSDDLGIGGHNTGAVDLQNVKVAPQATVAQIQAVQGGEVPAGGSMSALEIVLQVAPEIEAVVSVGLEDGTQVQAKVASLTTIDLRDATSGGRINKDKIVSINGITVGSGQLYNQAVAPASVAQEIPTVAPVQNQEYVAPAAPVQQAQVAQPNVQTQPVEQTYNAEMPQFSLDNLLQGIRLDQGYDPVRIISSLSSQIQASYPGKTIIVRSSCGPNGSGNTLERWLNGSHGITWQAGDCLQLNSY